VYTVRCADADGVARANSTDAKFSWFQCLLWITSGPHFFRAECPIHP
jgi:hypothetical protein